MKPDQEIDDFETRLASQPIRSIPEGWRAEILSAAQAKARAPQLSKGGWLQCLVGSLKGLSGLLWPSPKAWAGLAGIWLVLVMLNHAIDSRPGSSLLAFQRPATQILRIRQEEQRMLAELLGPDASKTAATADRPPRSSSRPRSELVTKLLSA